MNTQNKETWTNEVLNSGKKLQNVEASPFLFSKIMNRIEELDFLHQPVRASLRWGMLATLIVLVFANIFY